MSLDIKGKTYYLGKLFMSFTIIIRNINQLRCFFF